MTPFPLPSYYAAKPLLRAWARSQSSPIVTSPLLHQAVVSQLMATAAWQQASTVMVYCAMPHELDLCTLWAKGLQGKRFLFPRMIPRCDTDASDGLTLHWWEDIGAHQWTTYSYGLTEPASMVPVAQGVVVPDLCLLPALAMDRQGYRLGSGQGYYDRWLASLPSRPPVCLGVVPQGLVVDCFAHDPWDIPLDGWLSEAGLTLI